ncbi:MAG: membrane protein insertase YidC, partial [Kiritimatiellaeota bacterium]|nr:membrane protein insertase YidC [Kiritimatiellota bacterium]
MKKQDIAMIVAMVALLMAWPIIDRNIVQKYFFPRHPAPAGTATAPTPPTPTNVPSPAAAAGRMLLPPALVRPAATAAVEQVQATVALPERTVVLTNAQLEVVISSKGAAISSVKMLNKAYRESLARTSGPVTFDFSKRRALAPVQLAGVPVDADFDLQRAPGGNAVLLEHRTADGLVVRRTLTLQDHYLLQVTDTLSNAGSQPLVLPAYGLQLGPFSNLPGETQQSGVSFLGVDVGPLGGGPVHYLTKEIPPLFERQKAQNAGVMPSAAEGPTLSATTADWVAVKNKYFVQVLLTDDGGDKVTLVAHRALLPDENAAQPKAEKMTAIQQIAATLFFPETRLGAGETFTRSLRFYVGPKLYSQLAPLKRKVVDVMEFGSTSSFFSAFNWLMEPTTKALLWTMNAIHRYLWPHNYGLAIILLTILVRIVFWPVTHKSTESMKRMQAVQPLVNEVRQKFKDNAQKQQQEIMKLYKEHKVNPLGGCLPMLIQIPVFIALFSVLRSAIELRFAPFLWIRDLSEPENLIQFGFTIPLLGWQALNILPIVMAVTMAWQQKLTPSSGDAQQQKIMMIMPVMMLFFFYNFAAGLSLYWTT